MTFREANLRVFERRTTPQVLFQPRIEPWYAWHKASDRLPRRYGSASLRDLFDELGVSMRYPSYQTGIPSPVVTAYGSAVVVREETRSPTERARVIETPHGDLVRIFRRTHGWITERFPVQTQEDFRKLGWLFRNTAVSFSAENYEKGSRFIGDRGYPQFFLPRSPFQCLWIEWMKYEDLVYALTDCRVEVEEAMKAIDDAYDPFYEQLVSCGRARIVNFGENIDGNTTAPPYFESYCLPFYEKRAEPLRAAGIFTHIHLDGSVKPLLKYLRHLPFDGIEALTPLPQGDVTIEEIADALGDKILIDGIPALLFLPTFSRDDLMECVESLIESFYPGLVLGVSDEVPYGAPFEEAFERLRMVAEHCRSADVSVRSAAMS